MRWLQLREVLAYGDLRRRARTLCTVSGAPAMTCQLNADHAKRGWPRPCHHPTRTLRAATRPGALFLVAEQAFLWLLAVPDRPAAASKREIKQEP
jgi:hypothetical protein